MEYSLVNLRLRSKRSQTKIDVVVEVRKSNQQRKKRTKKYANNKNFGENRAKKYRANVINVLDETCSVDVSHENKYTSADAAAAAIVNSLNEYTRHQLKDFTIHLCVMLSGCNHISKLTLVIAFYMLSLISNQTAYRQESENKRGSSFFFNTCSFLFFSLTFVST